MPVNFANKNCENCARMKGGKMKTIKHEIKLERSVKIILGVLALGIFLNAFVTPISQELFGIKDALAAWGHNSYDSPFYIACSGCN